MRNMTIALLAAALIGCSGGEKKEEEMKGKEVIPSSPDTPKPKEIQNKEAHKEEPKPDPVSAAPKKSALPALPPGGGVVVAAPTPKPTATPESEPKPEAETNSVASTPAPPPVSVNPLQPVKKANPALDVAKKRLQKAEVLRKAWVEWATGAAEYVSALTGQPYATINPYVAEVEPTTVTDAIAKAAKAEEAAQAWYDWSIQVKAYIEEFSNANNFEIPDMYALTEEERAKLR